MGRALFGTVIAGLVLCGNPVLGLEVTPCTEGATIHNLHAGANLFHNYGDGKVVIHKMPTELEGLPAIKAAEPYKPQSFELSEPARGYWVFYPRVYTPISKDWRVFRQRAIETPFDYRDTMSDVYYKDFQAGRHEVKNSPNRLINVGFKALAQMTPRDCLLNIHSPTPEGVFRPGMRLFLNVEVDNPTSTALSATVKWRIVNRPGDWTLELSLPPKTETRKELPLPDLAVGFYLVDAELRIGADPIDVRRFPVGVFDLPGADSAVTEPFFPVGAYNKFFLSHDREISCIYLHAVCHSLRKHNLNCLVGPALDDPEEELNIAAKYGMRILMRVDQDLPKEVFGHKAVLAYMFGDEPKGKDLDRYKARYDAFIKEHPERPLVSAMVGESVGSLTDDDPVTLWKALGPQVRLARYYPIRKAQYDLLRAPIYKGMIPSYVAFDMVERCSPSPWWYVIQGFGGRPTLEKPDPYWRNPTPGEFSGLAHLALAFGARGIISWPLQSHGPEPSAAVALIKQETLEPEDGKYEAFAKVAADIAKAKEVLLRHQKGSFDVRSDRFEVLAVPRTDPATKKNYVYLVNMDARSSQRVKVTFAYATPNEKKVREIKDIYSGRQIPVEEEARYRVVFAELPPGGGQFWEVCE